MYAKFHFNYIKEVINLLDFGRTDWQCVICCAFNAMANAQMQNQHKHFTYDKISIYVYKKCFKNTFCKH